MKPVRLFMAGTVILLANNAGAQSVVKPFHLDEATISDTDVQIDILGDTAIAFFISHASVKLKARTALHEPTFRVSMVLHRTSAGWRVIHFHESALSAQAAQVMSSAA